MSEYSPHLCLWQGRSPVYASGYILPEAILVNLYCPECRSQAAWDGETMTDDGGWILEYDMDGAKFLFWEKGLVNEVTPDFLFDEGYCSWNGMTPQDLAERTRLHAAWRPCSRRIVWHISTN